MITVLPVADYSCRMSVTFPMPSHSCCKLKFTECIIFPTTRALISFPSNCLCLYFLHCEWHQCLTVQVKTMNTTRYFPSNLFQYCCPPAQWMIKAEAPQPGLWGRMKCVVCRVLSVKAVQWHQIKWSKRSFVFESILFLQNCCYLVFLFIITCCC